MTFYDCINTICQFIKPFLDNKMSIFEEYGAFNQNYSILIPFLPSGRFYLSSLEKFINSWRGAWLIFISIIIILMETPVLNANSVIPARTPHEAASDLGLHC